MVETKITKLSDLSATISVDGEPTVVLTAAVSSAIGVGTQYSEHVPSPKLYYGNLVEVRKAVADFRDRMYALEDATAAEFADELEE